MTPQEELEMFARLGGRFEQWLDDEYTSNIKYLVSATDPIAVRRAQGVAAFIEKLKSAIAKGKTLR